MKSDHNKKSRDLLGKVIKDENKNQATGQQHLDKAERELVKFNFSGENQ